jgi:uncharacterized repeat protein (TIGR04076 family)
MTQVRITVLERQANLPLVEAYMGDEVKAKRMANPRCDHFQDGDNFLVSDLAAVPAGFCAWAWADIFKEIVSVWAGGDSLPWVKFPHAALACCTDAYRPVVFKIERVGTGDTGG